MGQVYYLEDISNDQDYIHINIITQLQEQNQHDALAFILYIVMLECGFTSREMDILPTYNYKRIAESIEGNQMSALLVRRENVYNSVVYLNEIKCNLDLLVFSNNLIANLSVPQFNILKSKSFSCITDATSYGEIHSICFDFKINIAIPVRTLALSENSIYHASLVGMPYDVLVYLIKHYLKFQDFVSLVKTCKPLNGLFQEHTLWLHFCRRENVSLKNDEDPKTLFKEHWVSKRRPNLFYHFDVY